MAKRVQATAVLLAGGLLHAGQAAALGLGEMSLNSFLNEPLDAEVSLLDTRDLTADDIRIRLAEVDDFDRLDVERDYFLTSIEFTVSIDPATNRGVIRLSTEDPVVEPFLDLIIEARWPNGRLLREYTVLVDPPAFREETLTVSASERIAETEGGDASGGGSADAAAAPGERAATAVTGDRVQVLDSDLAPGEMPRRPFSEATADSPRAGSRYLVKRDETLWQIASRARPDGVSVQQAMLDIQRLNPEAFIDGNINRIKAGYIVYLPSAADISSDDLADALAEVREQNRAYRSGRGQTPGVTAAATLRISADDGAAGTREPSPADADRVAAAGSGRGEPADAGADSAAAAEPPAAETPAPREAEPAAPAAAPAAGDGELAAQLAAMAERLDALEATVSVKDQEIARLEAALREARDSAEAAAAEAAAARAQAAAPTPAPAPAPAPAPEAASSGGFMPWLYGLAGALVLGLLAVFGLRRFREGAAAAPAETARPQAAATAQAAEEEGDDVFAGVTLREDGIDDSAEAQEPPEPEAPARRDVAERGYGERRYDDYIDDADGGDALAEADIYIAYGRYLQAAELLTTAIRNEPENSAFRLKLLELYADMGEAAKAREQLEALREHGDADAIARGERIVGGAGSVSRAAPAAKPPEPEPAPVPEPEPAPEPEPEPEPEPGPAPATPAAAPAFDAGEAAGVPEAADVAEDSARDAGEDESLGAFDGLHIEEEPPPEVAGESLDLDLELDEPVADPVEATEAVDFGEPSALEESAGEEAPEDSAAGTPAAGTPAAGAPAGSGSESDDELMFAQEEDRMATRLDLARAYLDMGDQDGARAILEEVARGGNAEQQQEAKTLLDGLG